MIETINGVESGKVLVTIVLLKIRIASLPNQTTYLQLMEA